MKELHGTAAALEGEEEIEKVNNVRKAAVELLNGLIYNDDVHLERGEEYQTSLSVRLESVNGQLETQQLQMTVLERERSHKLSYVAESNERALWRGREAVKLVECVAAQVSDIIERTERLSFAQRNLTALITKLERFRSFVVNIDRLESLLLSKEYERTGTGSLLLATQQFASQFTRITLAPYVKEQLERFEHLQKMMQRQILDLFETTMKRRGVITTFQSISLGHAAVVIDVIGERAKLMLSRWYCDRQLSDYKEVFKSNKELSNLESVPKRYAWLKRLLVVYEAEHSIIFPPEWNLDEALCDHFCAITIRDIADMLQASKTIDLSLLQVTVQATKTFEQFLARKYPNNESLKLSKAFEPFLFYFVDAHDADLNRFRGRLPTKLTLTDFDASNLLASAPELFLLFKEILNDISDLSVGKALADLASVMARQLGFYAKYMEELMPRLGKKKSFTLFELKTLCVLINTADYCNLTTDSMAERINGLLHPHFKENVGFEGAQQEFLVQVSLGISRLHGSISSSLEPVWITMLSAVNWNSLKVVGDHSNYTSLIQKKLFEVQPSLRSTLVSSKHYVALCHKLVASIVKKFSDQLLQQRLRPISETAAQQLLVDLEDIRSTLSDLLRTSDYGALRAPFSKLISLETGSIENFLKCILAPAEPISLFVQNYLLITADSEESKFVTVLEAKGIKKSLYTFYLEDFRKHVPTKPSSMLTADTTKQGLRELQFFRLDSHLKKILSAVKL